MRIDEFEFQDRNGNEIEPTKNQLVIYIKSLHKQITELKKQLKEKEKEIEELQKDYEFKDKDCAINLKRFYDALTKNVQLEFLIKDLQNEIKSQPAEIVEKTRKELGLKLKYKLNDEVSVLKICNQINEVLDTILKEYQK